MKIIHFNKYGSLILFLLNFLLFPLHPASATDNAKKIFWVDSYNTGYEWSDGIERGIRSILQDENIELGVYHMNTKACKNQECMHKTAAKAQEAIGKFQPDVLIVSDDNAQKYLVVPNYKNGDIPVVFCGVNWDASAYGYPASNVTGMIEVELVEETVKHMQRYSSGNKIGYISGKTTSDQKIIAWLNKLFFNMEMISYQVKDFEQFKEKFLQIQKETDMLFIRNYAGIQGWDPLTAKQFIAANLHIPTGSNNDFMAPYVIFTLGKIPEEQGAYAAETALKILKGASISDLPINRNRQARLTVNLIMADAANIVLPVSILKVAEVIGREELEQSKHIKNFAGTDFSGKRILWVDSYHQGYEWSDGIESGIREVLFDTDTTLRIIRMDSKRENQKDQIIHKAKHVWNELQQFDPDIVIASDDNAQKYLVVPYLMDTIIPVVFCGVNWDADMYGYPTPTVTGMLEVDRTEEMLKILKEYAQGEKVGYLAGDVATERKLIGIYNEKFFGGKLKSYLVKSQTDLEDKYLQAQQEVDMLIFSNYTGIPDWDVKATSALIANHTTIPTGSHNPFMEKLVLCTLAKSPEEQGRYAATTSLSILSGEKPGSIPLTSNKQSKLTVNLQLAQKISIVFPVSMLKQARIIK